MITLHDTIQSELWSQIQCQPEYNRSVSLLFIKLITDPEYNPKLLQTFNALKLRISRFRMK